MPDANPRRPVGKSLAWPHFAIRPETAVSYPTIEIRSGIASVRYGLTNGSGAGHRHAGIMMPPEAPPSQGLLIL